MGALGGSFRLGRLWGIDIKIHYLFVLWIGMRVLQSHDVAMALLGEGSCSGVCSCTKWATAPAPA